MLPEHAKLLGLSYDFGGGWITGLATLLRQRGDIKLAIAATVKVKKFSKIENGNIIFYAIPAKDSTSLTDDIIKSCQKAEKDFCPDVIHVHGSEYYHGLLCSKAYLKTPAVLSLQGIINGYTDWVNGNLLQADLPFSLKEFLLRRSLSKTKRQWQKRSIQEKHIFEGMKYFIGRTHWDKIYINILNPQANYFWGGEILREAFYDNECWDIDKVKRHSIFCSSMAYPLKGVHILLEAVKLLKNEYNDISVTVPGDLHKPRNLYQKIKQSSYSKYLLQLIDKYKIQANVHAVGKLDEEQMKNAFLSHHLFVLPSFIDNSPNSVCEAQILGAPSLATNTGGVADIIEDNETGLLCQVGDPLMLASKIKTIFENDDLARSISWQSKKVAMKRHDKNVIVEKLLNVYMTIQE
ncbi:MAG: glycosyltransferase family 4 protein [Victivallaceae bacterium]|nr:glycosyltransferase family 4 protein [Victivallaceae bacterium]